MTETQMASTGSGMAALRSPAAPPPPPPQSSSVMRASKPPIPIPTSAQLRMNRTSAEFLTLMSKVAACVQSHTELASQGRDAMCRVDGEKLTPHENLLYQLDEMRVPRLNRSIKIILNGIRDFDRLFSTFRSQWNVYTTLLFAENAIWIRSRRDLDRDHYERTMDNITFETMFTNVYWDRLPVSKKRPLDFYLFVTSTNVKGGAMAPMHVYPGMGSVEPPWSGIVLEGKTKIPASATAGRMKEWIEQWDSLQQQEAILILWEHHYRADYSRALITFNNCAEKAHADAIEFWPLHTGDDNSGGGGDSKRGSKRNSSGEQVRSFNEQTYIEWLQRGKPIADICKERMNRAADVFTDIIKTHSDSKTNMASEFELIMTILKTAADNFKAEKEKQSDVFARSRSYSAISEGYIVFSMRKLVQQYINTVNEGIECCDAGEDVERFPCLSSMTECLSNLRNYSTSSVSKLKAVLLVADNKFKENEHKWFEEYNQMANAAIQFDVAGYNIKLINIIGEIIAKGLIDVSAQHAQANITARGTAIFAAVNVAIKTSREDFELTTIQRMSQHLHKTFVESDETYHDEHVRVFDQMRRFVANGEDVNKTMSKLLENQRENTAAWKKVSNRQYAKDWNEAPVRAQLIQTFLVLYQRMKEQVKHVKAGTQTLPAIEYWNISINQLFAGNGGEDEATADGGNLKFMRFLELMEPISRLGHAYDGCVPLR